MLGLVTSRSRSGVKPLDRREIDQGELKPPGSFGSAFPVLEYGAVTTRGSCWLEPGGLPGRITRTALRLVARFAALAPAATRWRIPGAGVGGAAAAAASLP